MANTLLTQVTIPNSVKYLSGFSRTKITSINIPNSIKEIGEGAFADTQITQVTLPQNCKYYSSSFPFNFVVEGGKKTRI